MTRAVRVARRIQAVATWAAITSLTLAGVLLVLGLFGVIHQPAMPQACADPGYSVALLRPDCASIPLSDYQEASK